MVYIRNKNVKGIFYSYLVKSRWDKGENTSKQEIIKYLGKASDVTLADIPEEFLKDQDSHIHFCRYALRRKIRATSIKV
jgi:hypothetical protein